MTKPIPGGRGRLRRIAPLLALAVVLLGGGLYLASRLAAAAFRVAPVPLQPLALTPERPSLATLPASFGDLAGRSLLLVTLDATRADRIGFYGNPAIETPNLDRLAGQGVAFTKAVATGPSTLPTHASILTGLYPYRHGARSNGMFRLGDEQRTLAEVLSEHGYATAAFVSSFVLDARFGLAQGFDVYDDETGPRAEEFLFAERRGDETTDRAIEWLDADRRRPFFLWVHYFDAHARYQPPEPFASRHALAYDGEIAFVDHQLGRLLAAVDPRETLTVVTADHGEALGEHGEELHAFLVQEATIQIPLILHAPDGLAGGVHLLARASQVDLVPTVLALLGIEAPSGLDGVDLAHPQAPDRVVLAETLEGRVSFGWSRLSALYQGAQKLVDGPRPELYDLSRDPIGHVDLAASRADDLSRLTRRLAELRGKFGDRLEPSEQALGRADVERLSALGYVVGGGSRETLSASGPGPDPREMLPLLSRVDRIVQAPRWAASMSRSQRALAVLAGFPLPRTQDESIRELEALAAEHPDFAPVFFILKDLYGQQGRLEEARRALERLRAARRGA